MNTDTGHLVSADVYEQFMASLPKWDRKLMQQKFMRVDPRELTPAQKARMRVGRNDPCPCGSGRKFKHCHWTGRKP